MPKQIGPMRFGAVMVIACLVLSIGAARADEPAGIIVSGTARVTAKPDAVEVSCTISGDAEMTADAIVKYRDARKRAVAAIEALGIAGLTIESQGYSVKDFVDLAAQQRAMQMGQVVAGSKQKVSVVEQLSLTIKNTDKIESATLMDTMLKIVDTARDAGLTIGSQPTVNDYNNSSGRSAPLIIFKIIDSTALREQAYKLAMDDAKTRAQKLADMAGVKLGRIISVREGNVRGGDPNPNENPARQQLQNPNTLTASDSGEIPLTLSLTVQYEIVK